MLNKNLMWKKKHLIKILSLGMMVMLASGLAGCEQAGLDIPETPAQVTQETINETVIAETAESDKLPDETTAVIDESNEITEETTLTTADSNTETSTEGKRIYFAAPLFNAAEREYNLKIVNILESYGYEVFLPQRDGFLAPELEGKTVDEKTELIFQKDKDEVLKSDIIFMLLDGRVPDEGACVELGIAYASGKRCYGLKSDARSVELDMDLDPMISGCFTKLFYDLNDEALIKSLEDYLEENQL